MQCPSCKKGRLKRLRTFVQGERVRRENLCPKCHRRPVTIELDEFTYLEELATLEGRISELDRELQHQVNVHLTMQHHASELFSFLSPAVESRPVRKPPKKAISAKKTRKR